MIASLLPGLVFSTIGFFLLREGKRRLNFAWLTIAVTLMFYSYFTSGIWDWLIGGSLLLTAYLTR